MATGKTVNRVAIPVQHRSANEVVDTAIDTPIDAQKAVARRTNRILLVALGLGGCVDFLFYGKATGVSTLLFVGLLLGALFVLARLERVRLAWRNLWLLAPLLFFAGMVALRTNYVLTWLNLAAVFVLFSIFVYFFVEGRVEQLGLLGYPVAVARVIKGICTRPVPVMATVKQEATANPDLNRRAMQIARGLLLALPILIVFTALLSSADSVFERYVGDVLQLHFLSNAPEMGLRIIIILAAAWVVAGVLLYALNRHGATNTQTAGTPTTGLGPLPVRAAHKRYIGFVEVALVMGLVNALFAAFAWIQFTVLFSGQAARTMQFEEYRDYVRRGFGELLVVAVLTMFLIVGLRWAMRWATEGQGRIFNALSTLTIALALVMLVSAFQRMVVWENIQFYINTQTRLYVRTFIVWLGLLFVWLLFTTWLRRDRFAIGAFLAAMGFLVSVNMLNPDADVAAYNIKRNDELSTRYLYLLSEDAIPALAAGLDTTTGLVHDELRSHLSARLFGMEYDKTWQDWQSFNLSRWRAYETLLEMRKAGKID